MRKRKFATLLIILTLCISYFGGIVKADIYDIDVAKGTSKNYEAEPGEKLHIKLPVRATLGFIEEPYVTANPASNAPFTTSSVTLSKDYTTEQITYITAFDDTNVEFDIEVKDTAKIGKYDLVVRFEYEDPLNYDGSKVFSEITLTIQITKEKAPAQLVIDKLEYIAEDAVIGNTFNIKLTIKNEGEITAVNTFFSLDFGSSGISPAYTVDSRKLGDIVGGAKTTVTLPVTILPTTEEGFKTLTANFTYKDIEGSQGSDARNIFITVQKASTATSENAKVIITSESYQEDILVDTKFSLSANLENVGAQDATNVRVSLLDGVGTATGILPEFKTPDITIPDLRAGGKASAEIPLIISSTATAGLQEITLQVSYLGNDNVTRTAITKAYLLVVKPKEEEEKEEKKVSSIDFSNVSQSPSQPVAAGKVSVTFTVTNTGNTEVNNLRLWGENLSSSNFEPLNSEPYHKVGNLAIGQKQTITLTFIVGSLINEGLNELRIAYSFEDEERNPLTGSFMIHILNVKNEKDEKEENNSKPKLIVTDFGKDKEDLRANDTFIFSFDIKNTHNSKAAKNIKVIINSPNDVFSATQGSSTFYIDKIEPEETMQNTIELKVKSDIATGAYELEIALEYEYDNMSVIDTEKGGVTDSTKLKLSAMENARPAIQNVQVYNWSYGVVMMNQSATMAFNFFNMGKSTLNNVYFTISGDFIFESGTMQYYGSAQPGGSEYLEYYVMPTKEGICSGIITVHFEDSNGNEETKEFEFSDIYVQGEQVNIGEPMDSSLPVDAQNIPTAKEEIVSLWLFLLIQGGILIVVIPVVRMIGIKNHKRKLRKQEDY